MITLVENSAKFGVERLCSRSEAKRIRFILVLMIFILILTEIFTISNVVCTDDAFDYNLCIRMLTTEIMIFSNTSIALYSVQCLILYQYFFGKCCREIEKTLKDLLALGKIDRKYIIKPPLERLITLHKLYISLRDNFKLNEDFLQPGLLIIYSIDVCLFLISYSYFTLMIIRNEAVFLNFDQFLVVKSISVVMLFSIICHQAERIGSVVILEILKSKNRNFDCRDRKQCLYCSVAPLVS